MARRSPCDRTCHTKGVRRFPEFRSVTHRSSFYAYCIASIFDTRLMRPYTCTYNVTEVMQLPRVTDATHASMPCAAQTQAQLLPHHAIAIATRSIAICHVHKRATPTPANRLRRRGVATTSCVRRGQAARYSSPTREMKSACLRARAGCAQRSAGEAACADRSLVAGATTTRQRGRTTIKNRLKRAENE